MALEPTASYCKTTSHPRLAAAASSSRVRRPTSSSAMVYVVHITRSRAPAMAFHIASKARSPSRRGVSRLPRDTSPSGRSRRRVPRHFSHSSRPSAEPSRVTSCYYAIGSSYLFNQIWVVGVGDRYSEISTPVSFEQGSRYFQRARMQYPARFIAYYDDPADHSLSFREDAKYVHHSTPNAFSLAFLDGHSKLSPVGYVNPFLGGPLFLFYEQQKQ